MNSTTAKRFSQLTLVALAVALPSAMASAQVQKPAQKQVPAKIPVTRAPLPNGPVVVKPTLQVQPGQGECEDGFLWNEIDSTCNPIGDPPGSGGGGGSGGTTTLDPVVINSPPKTPPSPPPTTNPVEGAPPASGGAVPPKPPKSPEKIAEDKKACADWKARQEKIADDAYASRLKVCESQPPDAKAATLVWFWERGLKFHDRDCVTDAQQKMKTEQLRIDVANTLCVAAAEKP